MERPRRKDIEDSCQTQIKSTRNDIGKMQNPDSFERYLTSKMGDMEDNRLKKAAEIAMQEIVNSVDEEPKKEHVFSERFEDQIRRTIIASTHIYKRKRRRRFLTLALSIVTFISLTFMCSPEVRAKVTRILKYVLGDNVVYEFDSSSSESTYKYVITELPEGYVTMSETFDGVIGTGLYGNDSSIMILSYESISEQGKTEIYTSGDSWKIKFVDGVMYEYYEAENPGEQNTIVWTNLEETVLFTLSSDFDLDSMVEIAKSVEKEK